jgi:hypothetical protein
VIALAFGGSRHDAPWSEAAFWVGTLLLVAPPAARLISPKPHLRERVALLLLVALGLYVVKVMYSPLYFSFYDEIQHYRTASDILTHGRLFSENPLLRSSAVFPALEIVTTAVSSVTGLSVYTSGTVVVGISRVVLVLSLFLLYGQIGGSTRTGGIAALIYAANPSFVYFDGQFAYETMALPFGALTLFLLVQRRWFGRPRTRVAVTVLALAALGPLVVAHHLTSYVFAGFLVLWYFVDRIIDPEPMEEGPGLMAAISAVSAVAWLSYAAALTVQYLAPPIGLAFTGMVRLLLLEGGRLPFQPASPNTIVAAPWERGLAFGAVAILLAGIALGAIHVWRSRWRDPLVVALVLASMAYPATLALRLNRSGALVSTRASATIFVAVALIAALAVTRYLAPSNVASRLRLRTMAWTLGFVIVFMGNLVVGWPRWQRLPGPYLVGADSRSIEGEGLAEASWVRDVLGPNHRIGADRTNTLLLGAYGGQAIVWYQSASLDLSPVFLSPTLGPAEREILVRARVSYLLTDQRLTGSLPQTGVYYDDFELAKGRPHRQPIDPADFAKFDTADGVSRIFDSGNVRIYDVEELSGAE